MSFVLLARGKPIAEKISLKLTKLWVFSKIVLIGMPVPLDVVAQARPMALPLILGGLMARSDGALLATVQTLLRPLQAEMPDRDIIPA